MAAKIEIHIPRESFFDGCIELDGIDQDATFEKYLKQAEEKIRRYWPESDVEVRSIPRDIVTRIRYYGDALTADGVPNFVDENNEEQAIQFALEEVYSAADFWVEEKS